MTSIKRAPLTHTQILNHLGNRTLHIPPLPPLFAHWPPPTPNPHLNSLYPLVSNAITTLGATRPSLLSRQKDDIPLLASLWYPHAPVSRLQTLARFTTWLVCWDDEVDANEGDLSGNFAKAEEWREGTVHVLKTAFGLSSDSTESVAGRDPLHELILSVGRELQATYTTQQTQHFFDKLKLFIRSCGTEQSLRLSNTIPDYDTYMAMRLNTVGGDALCALIEYSHGPSSSPLPFSPVRSELDKQVSFLLSFLNDLLSLKKELRTDCVINAVTSLMTEENTLESVVADVVGKMKTSVEVFDLKAREFEGGMESADDKASARRYTDGCRAVVTGTLDFTLKSPRYKLVNLLAPDASLSIKL